MTVALNQQQVDKLFNAMQKAHQAGNSSRAKQIATVLRKNEQALAQQHARVQQQPQPQPQPQPQQEQVGPAVGLLDAAGTLASGAVATPIAGLLGLAQMAQNAIPGDEAQDYPPAKTVKYWEDRLTLDPSTKTGKQYLHAASTLPRMYSNYVAGPAGDLTLDITGSPAAATAVDTGLEFLPGLIPGISFGRRFRPSVRKQTKADIKRTKGQLQEYGIAPGGKVQEQAEQFATAARQKLPNVQAEGMSDVVDQFRQARTKARKRKNNLYKVARKGKAGLPANTMDELYKSITNSMDGYLIRRMPAVKKSLDELAPALELPPGSVVRLRALYEWRKGLNYNKKMDLTQPEASALNTLKHTFDQFMQKQIEEGNVRGDADNVKEWGQANQAAASMKSLFDSDKALANIRSKELSPEEARQAIFGADIVKAKRSAAMTVNKLGNILGKGSPEFEALRQEALLDLMEPVLREEPNFKQFAKNYDAFITKRNTLAQELLPQNTLDALATLRKAASSIHDRQGMQNALESLHAVGAVIMFGHKIAKAAMRVRLATQAFGQLRRLKDKSKQRKFLGELLGYDPYKPLIPTGTLPITATQQTLERLAEEEQRARDIQGLAQQEANQRNSLDEGPLQVTIDTSPD